MKKNALILGVTLSLMAGAAFADTSCEVTVKDCFTETFSESVSASNNNGAVKVTSSESGKTLFTKQCEVNSVQVSCASSGDAGGDDNSSDASDYNFCDGIPEWLRSSMFMCN